MKQYSFLNEMRISYFKEEFSDKPELSEKCKETGIWHDQLDFKYKSVKASDPVFKDVDRIIKKNFSEHDKFHLSRMWKRLDCSEDYYIAEFGYGYNGGSPYSIPKMFNVKWIWYVYQIGKALAALHEEGYFRPSLQWIEDPKHSDVYSCYCEFRGKKETEKDKQKELREKSKKDMPGKYWFVDP